ncbi:uncharacterized protein LOC128390753 isoform X2 [Panonychus citri]|nr:uncharacterized protein LOC128385854 isoform X2 [Panonychus citri]XP_053200762.1 uncharacterized protein LOC128385854 isoform X2 [Panonychus citri]XP_053202487.1 uncharacterized protein LOC128387334 isoform X2 [Panonychus citri]XP_053202488.1 uncharacterized protein LOC128387334 isoform X2 [Panonychus citri]XP_053206480.1 uncharacterized protein LOC128390753 isoform X2 [Panonychus citri]XP_053206481.1 uncharacterized protein LOC128390753 isoform X2 [Panonychus citri]XP_053206482.1 uncharac
MAEKKPDDSESSRNANKSSTPTPEDLSFSHPFMGESSARVPVILYPLARRVGFSTIMLSALLYGITIVPALLAVSGYDPFGGSGLIPLALPVLIGAFAGRRRRRSLENHIPLERLDIDLDKIRLLIASLESPFGVTINNRNNLCSRFRLCRRIESFRQSLVKFLRLLFKSQMKHLPSINSNHMQALPKFPNS